MKFKISKTNGYTCPINCCNDGLVFFHVHTICIPGVQESMQACGKNNTS